MKAKLLTIAFCAILSSSFSQENPAAPTQKQFIVLYTTGESWDASKAPNQQINFKEHSVHLSELRKAKKIDIGARYGDTGMLVIRAKDEEEAKLLITADAAIKSKLFKVQVFPFSPFYKGCIE